MKIYDRHYIAGQWTASRGAGLIDVLCPATEEVIGQIPAGGPADIDHAVQGARKAFEAWSARPIAERCDYLAAIHDALRAKKDAAAALIASDVGMPLPLASAIQVGTPLAVLDSYRQIAVDFRFEEQVAHSLVVREPVGVVGCVTPWNYPLHQIVAKVAPALVAGCTVVVKPSEVAPLAAYLVAEIIDEVGLPPGVFNLVSGTGPAAGEALATHREVDLVSFTGSTRAGKRVAELAARSVKRVALELGGKSASILLPDADFPLAVKAGVNSCYLNSGQTCNALTRMLVPRSHHDEAVVLAVDVAARFTLGDPLAGKSKLGPLVSAAQRDRVRGYIRSGVEEGATLALGGPEAPDGLDKGYYVKPTIFTQVRNDMRIAQEEIFGPVLSIIPYDDQQQAVAIANDTPYGLAGAVWSADPERAKGVARLLRAGQVDINGGRFNILAPFGGYKQSGYGRELGKYGLEEYLHVKALQL